MIDNKRQELIHSQVMEILKENQLAFSNVARPKPTKASTATSASWSKDMAPKASAATQGAWDSTNTPGGVSSLAKEECTGNRSTCNKGIRSQQRKSCIF